MKKISEIGEKMYRNVYAMDIYSEGWFEEAMADEKRYTEEVYVYTEKERRELIYEVICSFVQPIGGKYSLRLGESIAEKVDMFIKDHNL